MFQLDDDFLVSLGIVDLPEEQKKALLQHIYEELELRVGSILAEGLSDEQMKEFDSLLQQEETAIAQDWLAQNIPGYENTEEFTKFMSKAQDDPSAALAEYAATKWLELNRPGYRDVVAKTLEDIKKEILQNRDAIVAS